MKKLLFLTALTLIGCENYTTNQQPIVIEKKLIVHDTITNYMTHECSKEYGVETTKVNGETWVVEIHKKSNDEIVYYIQPTLIKQSIEKQGGSNFEFVHRIDKDDEDLFVAIKFKTGKKEHEFYKTWPQSNYYMVETYNKNFDAGSLTISNPIPHKNEWEL